MCDRRQYTQAWLTFLRFFLGGLDGLSTVAVLFDLSCDFGASVVVAFWVACCCLLVDLVSFMVPSRSCFVLISSVSSQIFFQASAPSYHDAELMLSQFLHSGTRVDRGVASSRRPSMVSGPLPSPVRSCKCILHQSIPFWM